MSLWVSIFLLAGMAVHAKQSAPPFGPKDYSAPPIRPANTLLRQTPPPLTKPGTGESLFPKRYVPSKTYCQALSDHHHAQHRLKLSEDGTPLLDNNDQFQMPTQSWKFSRKTSDPLVVYFNPAKSRMTSAAVKRILAETYEVWRGASGVWLPELLLQETGDNTAPSSYLDHTANGRNEIGFRNLSSTEKLTWMSEKWKWPDRENDRVLVEVDTVFENRFQWIAHEAQPGNANTWTLAPSGSFDFRNAAVTHWGEFLGFLHSTNHAHSMCGMHASGQVHKFSLEAGDQAVVRKIYPA